MGRSKLSRSCLVLALIAVAIQGITPTAYDLASRGAGRLLSAVLGDHDFEEDDASPEEMDEPDWPGIPLIRKVTDRRPGLGLQAAGSSMPMMRSGASRISDPSRDVARIDGLIYSLCRLTC